MAKKNKNKQRKQVNPNTPKQPVVTQTIYDDALNVLVQSKETLATIPEDEVNVTEIEENYTTDGNVNPEDVAKCVTDLRKSIRILNSTKQRYEELKSQCEEEKKEWIKTKKEEEQSLKDKQKSAEEEYKKEKAKLLEKTKEIQDRELKLIEDEGAVEDGDHTAVIDRLIMAFKNNKEKVILTAETQIQEQTKVANEYLEKLDNVIAKESQLDIKEKELNKRRKLVEAKESAYDEDIKEMREEIREELIKEYEDKLNDAHDEVTRYQIKFEKSNNELNEKRSVLETIQSVFGGLEPSEMAGQCDKLKVEIKKLEEELASRPYQEDLDSKQKEVDYLTNNLVELRNKINEKEYLELKKMFDNNDVLIQDKQNLLGQVEAYKLSIANYKETLANLQRTISEINESQNKDNAFKASSKYDTGDYQIPMINATAPATLSDFISYLQSFMASPYNGDKELRYSKDTIKKFIAGLHMSPITILQGISGTGKTSLPRAVAMAMTADDIRYNVENGDDELPKAPYRICPIQSGWRDKMDLMGFYNSFEKSYHETEFFNALYLANQPKYEHTLFFIVLDEMNLSRPEHYFADFLSKLEQSEEQRKIKIDNVPEMICPASIIGGTLSIPKNVRFIGTANHDETTLEFAPKTYDRSNVIDMPRNCPSDNIPNFKKPYNVTYDWLYKKFVEAEKSHRDECDIFDAFIKDKEMLELLAERGIGVGNRFEGQARRFLSVFVEAGENIKEDTAKAADHLMTTRLLRALKDNYDLGYDTLDDFRERYKKIFYRHFQYAPSEAIDLIENELKKKK